MIKYTIIILLGILSFNSFAQCEEFTLEQEAQFTQNIALVQGVSVQGDSVEMKVIKKWKGDSIENTFFLLKEPYTSPNFVVDSGKTYMLFWYTDLVIDRCSRSSRYKYCHFEYELDNMFKGGDVVDLQLYNKLKYAKDNVFNSESGNTYDQSKGNYAFYDLESKTIKPFGKLPKNISYFFPLRYYEIDSNVETSSVKYEKVFAVGNSRKKIEVTHKLKKEVLLELYK